MAAAIKGFVAGRALGTLNPARAVRVFPVLICADTAMGAPLVNCLLQARFVRQLSGFDRPGVQPVTVLTVEWFETMVAQPDVPIPAMLRAWHAGDPEMATYPWLIIHERFFGADTKPNPWVRESSDAWKKEMLTRLWPGGDASR